VNLTGGTFFAGPTLNHGQINATAGLASFGPITGVGALNVGDVSSGTAVTSVSSFNQSVVNVYGTGRLAVVGGAAALHFVNTATSLTISGTGVLDLGQTDLQTATPASTIRSYLLNGYHSGDWVGVGGITSALAAANPGQYSVAYADGSDASARDAGIAVPPGQVLVRPTLTGDANLDGKVNFFDISQVLGYKYNTGQPASYTDGDLNYDGVVDFFDLTSILSSNYNTVVAFAVTGSPANEQPANLPEPAPLGVVFSGIIAALLARRRCRPAHLLGAHTRKQGVD
jgi:hypothetical protein